MGTTSRGNRYPESTDANDVPRDVFNLASDLDTAPIGSQGLIAARPAANKPNKYYWATDEEKLYYSDGAQWRDVTSSPWKTWSVGYITDSFTATPAPTSHSRAHYRLDGKLCTVQWSEFFAITLASTGSKFLRIKLPFAPRYEFNTFPAVVQATRPVGLSVLSGSDWYVDLRKTPNSLTDDPQINNESSWWYFTGQYEIA